MNILNVGYSDIDGGAARASYRIHRSLVDHGESMGLHSRMRVIRRLSDDSTVTGGLPPKHGLEIRRFNPQLNRRARRGFHTANPTVHSLAWPDSGLGHELHHLYSEQAIDLVHLHWLGDSTLSIEEIGKLPMPLVWTLHDQWPFCGAEHYTSPPLPGEIASSDERFAVSYSSASRPSHETGPDLNRRTWIRKRHAWKKPIHIVATTSWLADCAKRSTLMGNWPVTIIPYPLDLIIWKPVDKHVARSLLNLPPDRPLVLFGAPGGTADPRKGGDLLLESLQHLRSQATGTSIESLELVVFGQSQPAHPPNLGFPIHYRGHLNDDLSLRLHYAAADVMVVPSRQEAFGQTASEAQACGTPVVCFRTGGLVDVIEDGLTGLFAEPFDPRSLAKAIHSVCEDENRRRAMADKARKRALKLWNPDRISSLYKDVYQNALSAHY